MEINFVLNSPPFSVNSAYYRNRKRTLKCRKWGDTILRQLQESSIKKSLKELHDVNPSSLTVCLEFSYPRSKLYTKQSKYTEISRLSMDLSNIEKLLIDLIFDARYNERELDGKLLSNLNLDDKIITKLISSKVLNPDDKMQIFVSIFSTS